MLLDEELALGPRVQVGWAHLLHAPLPVLRALQGVEDSEGPVTGHVVGTPHVRIAEDPELLDALDMEMLQTEVQVEVLALVGVVHLPPAVAGAIVVDIHSPLRERLHGPVQEVPVHIGCRVQDVQRLARVRGVGPEEVFDTLCHWKRIHVQLQGPVVVLVVAILEEFVPDLDEDGAVEQVLVGLAVGEGRRVPACRASLHLHPEVCVDHGNADLPCRVLVVVEQLLRSHVAHDGVGVAAKDAQTLAELHGHHVGLIRPRAHDREAVQERSHRPRPSRLLLFELLAVEGLAGFQRL
mmetsp:Transcript_25306/g.57531  ORF Transcript_25306/g.57531 Transcript_25306/m.57531 type:complete len:295 (+) Transcript_25306:295-1179(+)